MKILIDIVHMADVNFYKNAINSFRKNGHKVILSVMQRSNLLNVVNKELGKASIVGKHYRGNIIIKIYSNIKRLINLYLFVKKVKPDVVTSFSYYPAAVTYFNNIPSIIFHDDPEYKKQFKLCILFASKFIIPDLIKINSKNIKKYHSYKEWAYLNPKYFKPSVNILKRYNLKKDNYIFIRDVAPVSLNYKNENKFNYNNLLDFLNNKKIKVVVSLENKSKKNEFKDCIILNEPVKNFYSFIYYSSALISSGDTMIREAALLGVPSFYIGKRKMEINKELINKKLIIPINNQTQLINEIKKVSKKQLINKIQKYKKELDDTTKIIVDEVLEYER